MTQITKIDKTFLLKQQNSRNPVDKALTPVEKTNEIIDEVNDLESRVSDLEDGAVTLDTITPNSGTLTIDGDIEVTGVATFDDAVVLAAPLTTNTGNVTQATSISTGVTLNKDSGIITTVSSTLAATGSATFTVTNANVISTDKIFLSLQYGGTGFATIQVGTISNGSFTIIVNNVDAVNPLNNILKIHFFILR